MPFHRKCATALKQWVHFANALTGTAREQRQTAWRHPLPADLGVAMHQFFVPTREEEMRDETNDSDRFDAGCSVA